MIDDGAGDGCSMENESSALSLSGRLLSFLLRTYMAEYACKLV